LRIYALGNEAIARGLLDAGVGVVAGYPGTPSTEVIESIVRLKGKADLHVEWSVNEKVALEVAAGASWSGVRSAATMKHVGLNVAADPFMTLAYTGVVAGLVLVVADDPGCHSSQNEQDTRRYAVFANVPCLDPASPQEAYDMARTAPSLSEDVSLPVILRPTTRVSHAKADIEVVAEGKNPSTRGTFKKNPARWVMVPAHARAAHKRLVQRYSHLEELDVPWSWIDEGDGVFGIATGGVAYTYVKETCARMKASPHILKVGAYPLNRRLVLDFFGMCERVLVVEELEPVIEQELKTIAKEEDIEVEIAGKTLIPPTGELNVDIVEGACQHLHKGVFSPPETLSSFADLPKRPPVMCAGCGHRAAFYEIEKVFGKEAVFPSDIGCYTLGVAMGMVDTTLCMGASITVASGISYSDERSVCCTIGDSTFVHTGIAGLINAAYNGAKLTVVIMDNRTTAMTGHQPHPAVGITAEGEHTVPLDLAQMARACGVAHVSEMDPYDVDGSIEVLKAARDYDGLSVVIARRECVVLARRRGAPVRRYAVDAERCTGCKRCVGFGCPAIGFSGGRAYINELCVGCTVCAQICPFDAIAPQGLEKE